LAPINGRPFLAWQLDNLERQGVKNIILALGHGASQVVNFIASYKSDILNLEYLIEDTPLGTGGAILNAMNHFHLNECMVLNGDTFLTGQVDELFKPLRVDKQEFLRLGVVWVNNCSRYGQVISDNGGLVLAINEKSFTEPGYINAGFYRLHRDFFDPTNTGNFSFETHILQSVRESSVVSCIRLKGSFIDIGVEEDYKKSAALIGC
jgi:D-glycero-alpha-D-manno-heptose 1-phosphate guanylyltransferase